MPIRFRLRRPTVRPADRDLLADLIAAPPAAPERRLQPIALRSRREQRRHALQGYLPPRTWVDAFLVYAERATIAAVLLFFGYWLADGPLRDWLHSYQNPVAPAPIVVAAAPTARVARAAGPPAATPAPVLLPYTTLEMAQPPADEFSAQRQAPAVLPAVASQPTRLQIPAIALDTPIKEVFVVDGAWEVADYAAGYMHGTGLPGTAGNTVLAGHAGLRGAVFRDLGALVPGDEIYIDAAGLRFRYTVREALNVWPNQVEVLAPTTNATMTLITCTNWDTQRLVVVADFVDSQPAPRP